MIGNTWWESVCQASVLVVNLFEQVLATPNTLVTKKDEKK